MGEGECSRQSQGLGPSDREREAWWLDLPGLSHLPSRVSCWLENSEAPRCVPHSSLWSPLRVSLRLACMALWAA